LLTSSRSAISVSPTTRNGAVGIRANPTASKPTEEGKNGYDVDTLHKLANVTSDQLASGFEAALSRQGRTAATRRKYLPTVRAFLDWSADLGRPATSLDVDLFLAHREAEMERRMGRRPRRATVRSQIAALRSFCAYLERNGLLSDLNGHAVPNPMAAIVAPSLEQRPNDFLRPFEDAALLECGSPPPERLVVWLLRWTGLRVAEACSLRLQDLDLTPDRENLIVRKSKTIAGMRTIPLVPNLIPELHVALDRLRSRGIASPQAYLLSTRSGKAYKPTFVWRLVKRAGARAEVRLVECECGSPHRTRHNRGCPRTVSGENLSAISPHTLRRTFGSYLLKSGFEAGGGESASRSLEHGGDGACVCRAPGADHSRRVSRSPEK
jgi:integrase